MEQYHPNPTRKMSCMDKGGHPTFTTILAFLALVACALDGLAIGIAADYVGIQAAYGVGLLLDLYMLSIAIVASWSTITYSVKGRYPLKSKSYNVLQWCALVGAILRLIIAIAGAALFLTYGAIVGIIVGLCYCGYWFYVFHMMYQRTGKNPNYHSGEAAAGLTNNMAPMGGYAQKPYYDGGHPYAAVGSQTAPQLQYAAPAPSQAQQPAPGQGYPYPQGYYQGSYGR
ncbi:uncharacterized protein LOC62_05G007732 [Vanrija pseudolonga]|uniref:Uncharacterized protein n=1 Tax=Vanrija pseudolonga TaxID=143232 RepID=A0AAF0YGJ3_9TREE|nr:hypothetical protein LOC62_05G007732 [Vanrija pseudolonga]